MIHRSDHILTRLGVSFVEPSRISERSSCQHALKGGYLGPQCWLTNPSFLYRVPEAHLPHRKVELTSRGCLLFEVLVFRLQPSKLLLTGLKIITRSSLLCPIQVFDNDPFAVQLVCPIQHPG